MANALLSAGRAEEAWRGLAMALLQLTHDADEIFERSSAPLFAFDRAVRDALDVEPGTGGEARNPNFETAFEEALATFR